jgi:serine O-acetyltransferase
VGAIIGFRLAHVLDGLGAPLVARLVAAVARRRTGIDIHPAATIGSGFSIVGGQGIVIGDGTVLGSGVRLYGAVTLGALGEGSRADVRGPRPGSAPVIEDDVTIYPGATILGPVTVGRGAVIGGGLWLTESVAPGTRVVQASPRRVDA